MSAMATHPQTADLSLDSSASEIEELESELKVLQADNMYHQFLGSLARPTSGGGPPATGLKAAGDALLGVKTRKQAGPVEVIDLLSSDEEGDDMAEDVRDASTEDSGTDEEEDSVHEYERKELEAAQGRVQDVEVPLDMKNEKAKRFPFLWRTKAHLEQLDDSNTNGDSDGEDFNGSNLVEGEDATSSEDEDDKVREIVMGDDKIAEEMRGELAKITDQMELVTVESAQAVTSVVANKEARPSGDRSEDEMDTEVKPPSRDTLPEYFKTDDYKDEEDPDFDISEQTQDATDSSDSSDGDDVSQ
eukprot:maker-scaffold303_size215788-snap-gene-1.15 protein:Tk07117 transcript:maker-scaffold303_size215788-snap-gene-1.15-mRNA-1 annotation:"thyroid receptor-interacting protein 11-like isoform x3"